MKIFDFGFRWRVLRRRGGCCPAGRGSRLRQCNDSLFGQSGNDFILGGAGSDFMNGGAGFDYCNGGPPLTDSQVLCEVVVGVP